MDHNINNADNPQPSSKPSLNINDRNGDRRFRRTEQALRDALIRLIAARGYDAITVKDIADEADSARVTFYRHYKDKQDLLLSCIEQIYLDLIQHLDRSLNGASMLESPPILTLYQHIQTHQTLYRTILSSQAGRAVESRIRDYLTEVIKRDILRVAPHQKFPVPLEIISAHIAVSELGLILWWLERGQAYPIEYIARTSSWLSFVGIVNALDVSGQYPLAVLQAAVPKMNNK